MLDMVETNNIHTYISSSNMYENVARKKLYTQLMLPWRIKNKKTLFVRKLKGIFIFEFFFFSQQ